MELRYNYSIEPRHINIRHRRTEKTRNNSQLAKKCPFLKKYKYTYIHIYFDQNKNKTNFEFDIIVQKKTRHKNTHVINNTK